MSLFAATPEPPYHVVIFASQRNLAEGDGYGEASERMMERVKEMDGFLGVETVRGEDGFGLTVSYWRDEAAAEAWRTDLEHLKVQGKGKAGWYTDYVLRAGKVERERRMR